MSYAKPERALSSKELHDRIEEGRHAVEVICRSPKYGYAFKHAAKLMMEKIDEFDSTESKTYALVMLEDIVASTKELKTLIAKL